MSRRLGSSALLAALSLFATGLDALAQTASGARAVMVTDVTPRSFSLVWLASPNSVPTARVFEGGGCSTPAAEATVTSFPTMAGDPRIAAAAAARGVMKVLISGLAPDKGYCVQAVSTAPGAAPDILPLAPIPVRTAALTRRSSSFDDAAQASPATNDLLRFEIDLSVGDVTPGTLILARIDGAVSPVTGFAGDGVDKPSRVLFDLNNVYFEGSSSTSLDLQGGVGERVSLLEFGRGGSVVPVHGRLVPRETGLAAPVDPDSCTDGQCDGALGAATGGEQLESVDPESIAAFVAGSRPDLPCLVCADANHDGVVDMRDALIVAQTLARLRRLP